MKHSLTPRAHCCWRFSAWPFCWAALGTAPAAAQPRSRCAFPGAVLGRRELCKRRKKMTKSHCMSSSTEHSTKKTQHWWRYLEVMSDFRYLQHMTFSSLSPKSQTPLGTSTWPSKTTPGQKYRVCCCLFTVQPWSKHTDPESMHSKNIPIFVQYSAFFRLFYFILLICPSKYRAKMLTPNRTV